MSTITAMYRLISDHERRIKFRQNYDSSGVNLQWDDAAKLLDLLNINETVTSISSMSRIVAKNYIERAPTLRQIAASGRDKLASNLSVDEKQVFRCSGLFDAYPDDDCLEWWDRIFAQKRLEVDSRKSSQGRLAERWSIESEKELLLSLNISELPVWVSLEGDWQGYDIRSFRPAERGLLRILMIEVKSYSAVGDPKFYLTRNEWQRALQATDAYRFHVWCIENGTCMVLSVEEVALNTPIDQLSGEWQNVLVRL